MAKIHSSAIIDAKAEIAEDAEIGPYCVVGPHVAIGPGVRVIAHAHLTGHTEIGARTVIGAFASLGTPPQSVRYRGGPTRLVVGADCDLREHVTMNTGTEDDRGVTRVGDRCLFMVNAHVGHDCQIGNGVTCANNVALGGHVSVGDSVFIGGQSGVHQFVRIGEGAMISGLTGVAADVIPFGLAVGQRAVLDGLNIIGLRRRNYGHKEILRLRRAYRQLFHSGDLFQDRLQRVVAEYSGNPFVAKILAFIRADAKRPLMMPASAGPATGPADEPS